MNKPTDWLEKWREDRAELALSRSWRSSGLLTKLADRDAAALELAEACQARIGYIFRLYPEIADPLYKLRAVVEGRK